MEQLTDYELILQELKIDSDEEEFIRKRPRRKRLADKIKVGV